MANVAGAKSRAFRRSKLWIASLIALALGSVAATFIGFTRMGQSLELDVSDRLLRPAASLPDESQTAPVVTIEIDDASIAHAAGGRWPWARPTQAEFLDALASLQPRLITLDIEYSEAETFCIAYRPRADSEDLEPYVLRAPDTRLRESLARAGNVLVPFSLKFVDRPEGQPAAAPDRPVDVPAHLRPFAVDMPPQAAARLRIADSVNAVIPNLADVAFGSGYTSILKDPDQAVRRVPALAQVGGRVFPHLGVEMAGLWRFGPGYGVRLDPDRLVVQSADGSDSVSVPVDRQGQLALRWPTDLQALDRMSAGPILDLVLARRRLGHLNGRWRLVMAELDALLPDHGWAKARAALDEAETRLPAPPGDTAAAPRIDECRQALERSEERLVLDLMQRAADAGNAPPESLATRCAQAVERYGSFISVYHDSRDRLSADVAAVDGRVRPRIEGRLCILGHNITAGTDQHRTPISPNQPGVTVYPCVVRTILSGAAFRQPNQWVAWAMAVVCAWLVGVLSSRLETGWGIVTVVWLSAAVLVFARTAASSAAVLLPVAGPSLAIVVAFAGVSGYRQLTEASSRRFIARVFEQYTSPELLAEIQRNPESLRLGGERRDITVIFSDIAGFTPLSETLDAERLVVLLNHYLGAMTDILKAERATLDKYEGDGILAFIGAPVAVPDHPLRAVRAALRMQGDLPHMCQELAEMGLLPADRPLRIRVGCSSGPASVGNFGSEKRVDYTAMGDTVNLGGRLEEANRWLGSKILIPEATRSACGDAVLFRSFGLARIRGKAEPMRLYEPLALEPAPANVQAVAEAFGRAIDALEQGDVAAAEAALADLRKADADDGPTQVLAKRIEEIRAGRLRPEEPWNLARPK